MTWTERDNHRLQEVVYASFIIEVNALKPGNVSRYADGHNMTLEHFVHSAKLVSPILCDLKLSIGQRIYESVRVTMENVGCNTNLGMILLFAPVVITLQKTAAADITALQGNLKKLLEDIDDRNAAQIFAAISLAGPGGLGGVEKFDVNSAPTCGLLEAMGAAQNRDLIAKQYVTGFADIFSTGVPCLAEYDQRWKSVEWATVACYLTFLAEFADSHIVRKYGPEVANLVRLNAHEIARQFKHNNKPDSAIDMLLAMDRDLKDQKINPGTTADMTAVSVLIHGMYN